MPGKREAYPPPNGRWVVRSSIGDVTVSLHSDLKQVVDDFARLYPPHQQDAGTKDREIRMEVRRSGRSRIGRRLYSVYADGAEIGGWRPSNGIFPLIEWGINLRVIETRPEYLQLHAASMVCRGQGFIFAGESGHGKSTLAAILLAQGWQYLCDEFALVDVDTLTLHPFPKALCIKTGSYPVIRKLGLQFARRRDYVKAFKGRVGYLNPRERGDERVGAPTPARFIVFPTYRSGGKPCLTPVSRAYAVMELYRCCFNKRALPEGSLPALAQLVGHANCFRLEIGDPVETKRILEALLPDTATSESNTTKSWKGMEGGHAPRLDRKDRLTSRREMLRVGAKLAYVAPSVLTLTARQALAVASNPSGICSTAMQTGELCETDADCCSKDCDFGLCR